MDPQELEFSPNRQLDLYLAAGAARPLVVFVHGGGFVSGSKDDARCVQAATFLRDAGFNCASVSYSLAEPGNRFARWPQNLFDVANAVAYLHEQAPRHGYDMSHFAMLGFSAGCCLSNLYMQGGPALFEQLGHDVSWFRPAALVGFYGPYDFSTRQAERRSTDPEINRLHSPRHWLLKNSEPPPPVLHVQGDEDTVVYPDQHARFRADCEKRGYAFEEILAPGFDHAFAPRDSNRHGESINTLPAIAAFLNRHLEPRDH